MERKDIEGVEFVRVVGAGLGHVGFLVETTEENVTIKTANTTGPDDFLVVNYPVIEKLGKEDIEMFLVIVADCKDIYAEFIYDLNNEPKLSEYHIKGLEEDLKEVTDRRMKDYLLQTTNSF